jgi:hypothetical protein
MDRPFNIKISKSSNGDGWNLVATGTWIIGTDPVLLGESIPPRIISDLTSIEIGANVDGGTAIAQDEFFSYQMSYERS